MHSYASVAIGKRGRSQGERLNIFNPGDGEKRHYILAAAYRRSGAVTALHQNMMLKRSLMVHAAILHHNVSNCAGHHGIPGAI